MNYRIDVNSQTDTKKIAEKLASCLSKGDVITFEGELGAGKTFFISQMIRYLMNDAELIISSPTFNLVHHYTYDEFFIKYKDRLEVVAGDFRTEERKCTPSDRASEVPEKRSLNASSLSSIWHFDLYRLKHLEEIYELGFDETYGGIALIEWPQIILSLLPKDRLDINIIYGNDEKRTIFLDPKGSWQDRLKVVFDDK